jgi:A/G-specific adenine glycosylase
MAPTERSAGGGGREALLAWYGPRRAAYPWRGGADPYAVLVSEVMLQQTQATRVAPTYLAFLRRFPSVRALARASRADVLRAWDGLGYNRRALALWEAAGAVVRDHGGVVPSDPEALRRLPGVGPYTAAAVAAVAFGVPVAAVDTNVRRVVARVHVGREPDELTPRSIRRLAGTWLDRRDPGSWNQALMDLGREVCRPRPRCGACPLAAVCRWPAEGAAVRGPAGGRRAEPFEGSSRQVRGAVVRALRRHPSLTLGSLAREVGGPRERVERAVRQLAGEGLVRAGPAALAGRPSGRVRLPG